MVARRHRPFLPLALLPFIGLALFSTARPAEGSAASPIDHVVVLYLENHSFNDVLGKLCLIDQRCVGSRFGQLLDGRPIRLSAAHDIVPLMGHGTKATLDAIDKGAMDGFERVQHCSADEGYGCFAQYGPRQIPNLAALARAFVISDSTFNSSPYSSFASHIALVSATEDGFVGNIPRPSATHELGVGWGCDSFMDASWQPPAGGQPIFVPTCIPDENGFGPYRESPVEWVPTIMDRMDQAGLSWRIDGAEGTIDTGPGTGYIWTTCPSFAACLYSEQVRHLLPASSILFQANAGQLPNLALVVPTPAKSQHNGTSMRSGDNWIGKVVGAVMSGPQWASTAIFITYDDCGCFYDGVAPPPGFGIRTPMVIVSPYAKPGFTDSNLASTNSILAFVEHNFGLPALGAGDGAAYDYSESFDFTQSPQRPVAMRSIPLAPKVRAWLAKHPVRVGDT